MLADRTTGLLVPGTPVLADLNGDGIPDLIVPNSGGNNVLVYPGLPGGGFGPAMNNGNGFFTGTNPVSVVVADVNGDGRPDLIVANKGSNDVSILLNEPAGDSFTFVQGPRLRSARARSRSCTETSTVTASRHPGQRQRIERLDAACRASATDSSTTSSRRSSPLTESPGPIFAGPFGAGQASISWRLTRVPAT